MQYPNWLLHYLIFQEGIRIHVEPGNIFKRKAGTKVARVSSDIKDVITELEYVEIIKKDKDGNLVVKKVY